MEYQNIFKLKREPSDFPVVEVTSSDAAYDVVKKYYGDDIDVYESMFGLLLDASLKTLGYFKLSQGGIIGTVVDVKLIAKYAVESLATSVILCHNHPSGNLKASDADIRHTSKVKNALLLLDVSLSDHLIITKNRYLSMANEGLI